MGREGWGTDEPVEPLDEFGDVPARYVIIDQFPTEGLCTETQECIKQMRVIQQEHVVENGTKS